LTSGLPPLDVDTDMIRHELSEILNLLNSKREK
jgi:hypothetical protein